MKQVNYTYTPAQIFNEKWWIEHLSTDELKNRFESGLNESQFHILNYCEHFFDQQGFTCVWLLAESHLAIHTFPEDNKIYVELSSCNLEKLERFKNWMKQFASA